MISLKQFILNHRPGVKIEDIPDGEYAELVKMHIAHKAEERKADIEKRKRQKKIEKDQRKKLAYRESHRNLKKNTEPKQYRSYRLRANAKSISFELSQDEFFALIEMDCRYCGGSGGGIDRMNSREGYSLDNCVPCCSKCNIMKFTFSVDDFLKHIKKIFHNINQDS